MIIVVVWLVLAVALLFWSAAPSVPRWVDHASMPTILLTGIALVVWKTITGKTVLSDASGMRETPLLRKGRWETRLIAALIVLLALFSLWMMRTARFGLYRLITTGMQNGAFEK